MDQIKETTEVYPSLTIFHPIEQETEDIEKRDQAIRKLMYLPLKSFNPILSLVEEDDKITGVEEPVLKENPFELENIDFDSFFFHLEEIKSDLHILSENGFMIQNLSSHYAYQNNRIIFTEIANYPHCDINSLEEKQELYKKNLETMNHFLIALIIYNAYQKGSVSNKTLTLKAIDYNEKFCKDIFFGDYFKNMFSLDDEENENSFCKKKL